MNTEVLLLRGLPNLFATVGIETLVGGGSWFTQALHKSTFNPSAFGQVVQNNQRARINWLLNLDSDNRTILTHLLDNLAFEAGLHGAKFLSAAALNDSHLFEVLRQSGYCIYGWERFWLLKPEARQAASGKETGWETAIFTDLHDILKFQRKNLSPAIRSVVSLADEVLPDFIFKENDILKAYATVNIFSQKGILYPIFAPDCENRREVLMDLLEQLPKSARSWYVVQTTSHDWLEDLLEEIATPISPRTELLVKYFAVMEKMPVGILNHNTESSHPDPIAPYMHSSKQRDNL